MWESVHVLFYSVDVAANPNGPEDFRVRLQDIWHAWMLEPVETLGFVARFTAFLRANVSALSLLGASSIPSLLPQYTSSGVTLPSTSRYRL